MTLTLHLLRALMAGLLAALAVLTVFGVVGYVTGAWLPGDALAAAGSVGLVGAVAHLVAGVEGR